MNPATPRPAISMQIVVLTPTLRSRTIPLTMNGVVRTMQSA
jgi:hypothetical protein